MYTLMAKRLHSLGNVLANLNTFSASLILVCGCVGSYTIALLKDGFTTLLHSCGVITMKIWLSLVLAKVNFQLRDLFRAFMKSFFLFYAR